MDDLTQIKGIGKATAKRLADAGFASFAALAAASSEQLQAIEKLGGSPAEWSEWVADAKTLAPAPVDLSHAAPEQIDAQAARIDAARDRLDAAVARVDVLSADLGNGTDVDLEQSLDDAEAEREAAQQALDLLIGPGEISRLEPASDAAAVHVDAAVPATPQETIALPDAINFNDDRFGEISTIGAMLGIGAPEAGEVAAAVQALLTRLEEAENTNTTPESAADEGEAGNPAGLPAERIAIVVVGPKKGRRRAGHVFGPNGTPVLVTLDELDQIDADESLSWSLAEDTP